MERKQSLMFTNEELDRIHSTVDDIYYNIDLFNLNLYEMQESVLEYLDNVELSDDEQLHVINILSSDIYDKVFTF